MYLKKMTTRKSLSQKIINGENEKKENVTLKENILQDPQNIDLNERIASVENKLNLLISILNSNYLITENCPKNSEGKRQLPL